MADKNSSSSILLKIGLGLVLLAGAVVGATYALRRDAYATPVTVGTAADAVAGSLVVHADGDLKELKSEVSGRVAWAEPLTPDGRFKRGDVLLKLETVELDVQIADAKRNREISEARLRVTYEKVPNWTNLKDELDAAEAALAAEKGDAEKVAQLQKQLDALTAENDPERIAAQRALDIAQRLFARNEVPKFEVDQKQAALDAIDTRLRLAAVNARDAKEIYLANIRALERAKGRMSILAPDDGQVSEVNVFRGALINAGQTVARWFSDARTVVAKVSEEDISRVKLGQSARVTLLKFPGQAFNAKVDKILTSADPDTQRYTVYLNVDAPLETLVPFATGEVVITIDSQPNRLLIPRRAIFDDKYVSVVKGGRVQRQEIEVGYRGLNQAEVKKGLAEGDMVIVDQPELYEDGTRVRVLDPKA